MRERGRFGEDDEDFQRYCKRVGPGCKRQWAELNYASSTTSCARSAGTS